MAICELAKYGEGNIVPENIPYPNITFEQVAHETTGELVLPVRRMNRWIPTEVVLTYLNALNRNAAEAEILRRQLTFKLDNNTPFDDALIGHNRPVSAYFFYDQANGEVIIEWGRIDPKSGKAKLHSMLNRTDRVKQLIDDGMRLSSGHMAQTRSDKEYLACLDSIGPNTSVDRSSPLGQTVNTLYNHGFIVLTAEGRVQLPAF